MTVQEKKDKIQALVNRVNLIGFMNFINSKFNDGQLVPDIFGTYRVVMNRHYNVGCKSCFTDCFMELKQLLTNDILEKMENQNYKLKKGIFLDGFAFGRSDIDITEKTVTDQLAEIHLKLDPGRIKFFEKYPEDWELRCGKVVIKEANTVKVEEKKEVVQNVIKVNKPTRNDIIKELKKLGKTDKNTISKSTEELEVILNEAKK